MSRKKIIPEELYEEEKIIPEEENNCCSWKNNKCSCLSNVKMTKQDKVNCGTLRCKFYKPKEHENSVKHITPDGVYFETYEEYVKANNYAYLKSDELKAYELMPHASEEEVDKMFEEYMKNEPNLNFKKMKKTELFDFSKELGFDVNSKMKKEDLLAVLAKEGFV